jgi:hypothetical protein
MAATVDEIDVLHEIPVRRGRLIHVGNVRMELTWSSLWSKKSCQFCECVHPRVMLRVQAKISGIFALSLQTGFALLDFLVQLLLVLTSFGLCNAGSNHTGVVQHVLV